MKCQCGTIRQVHQQLLADGYHVTVNALRAWAKQGVLPVAYIGKKAYLTYDNAVNVLRNGTTAPSMETNSGGIRRIAK